MSGIPSSEPLEVAEIMRGFGRRWFIAGGWAVDLFIGRETRPHKDIEIAVLREDQMEVRRHFSGWGLNKILPDKSVEAWPEGQWLELPIHEIHAERGHGNLRSLEILLNDSSREMWRFRRNPEIGFPMARIGRLSSDGVPFLVPEIVLLYKAKNSTCEDMDDFDLLEPLMGKEGREWLAQAIAKCHPGHPWLARL
jgi:hypothetical protein